MKISFLDHHTVTQQDIDFKDITSLSKHCLLLDLIQSEPVAEAVSDSDIIITNKIKIDAPILDRAASLKLICIAATGTNNVDLNAAARRGIPVCNVRDYATPSVVQHVFALILALRNHVQEDHRRVMQGEWTKSKHFCLFGFPVTELSGKKLGIIGYGVLGQGVAHVARAFGMEVLIAQRPTTPPQAGRMPFNDVLAQADILSLHCPLTPDTEKLIHADTLALMPPHALLINTARGGLIDETALAEALKNRRIGGAGLDVLSVEPPPDTHPLLDPTLPNLIITPHIAWASREARQRLINEVAKNIRSFLAGSVRNRVN